jgi:predicted nucleic acid-binding Zn ribbon protein
VSDEPLDPQSVENVDADPRTDTGSAKSGIDLAREALAQAKADARERGALPGQVRKKRRRPVRESGRGGDPTAFGPAIRELLAARGWQERVAVGGVFGRWPQIVGPELAEHTRPETFEDGVLVVAADSANWATQVRLLAANLVKRLNEDLGHGTVRRVKVVGPSSGQRGGGRLRVTGGRRTSRDT